MAITLVALLSMLSLGLVGCGGGSGGLSVGGGGGGVAKSPISGATLSATDANGIVYSNIGTTTSTGAIEWNSNYPSSPAYPLRINATDGKLDSGNGKDFTGNLRGVLNAEGEEVFITPASTVVTQLFESGYSLDEAKATVRSIVQNSLGISVDPLADFTASTSAKDNNELAQQALLYVLGIDGDETADTFENSMNDIENKLSDFSNSLAAGNTVAAAVATVNTSFDSSTTGLTSYVASNIDQIASRASSSITGSTIAAPTVDTTKKRPGRFYVVNAGPSTSYAGGATSNITVTNDTTSRFTADGTSNGVYIIKIGMSEAGGPAVTWGGANVAKFQFTSLPTLGTLTTFGDATLALNTDYDAAPGGLNGVNGAPVFKYTVTATKSGNDTITVKSTTTDGETITRTINISLINPNDTITASEMSWKGTGKIKGLGTATGSELKANDAVALANTDISAQFKILGVGRTPAQVDETYRIAFEAPSGFGFYNTGYTKTWANYDQATSLALDSTDTSANTQTLSAYVPNPVQIKATKDMPFGGYVFKAKLINKSTNAVERTATSKIFLVRAGTENWPAEIKNIRYSNDTITTAKTSVSLSILSASDKRISMAATNFAGVVETWNERAGITGGTLDLGTNAKWLLSSPKNAGFGVLSPIDASDNYCVTTLTNVSSGNITIDLDGDSTTRYFTPRFGEGKTNQDAVSIRFQNDEGIKLEGSGSVVITSTN